MPATMQQLPSGRHGMSRSYVRENQRKRLETAVRELVESIGYEATTVSEIIARAGVSRKTFYEFFEDRADCLKAACGGRERLATLTLRQELPAELHALSATLDGCIFCGFVWVGFRGGKTACPRCGLRGVGPLYVETTT